MLIFEKLIKLDSPLQITDSYANALVAQLLFLQSESSHKQIMMYINSPGGSVVGGLAIYDTMMYIRPEVKSLISAP